MNSGFCTASTKIKTFFFFCKHYTTKKNTITFWISRSLKLWYIQILAFSVRNLNPLIKTERKKTEASKSKWFVPQIRKKDHVDGISYHHQLIKLHRRSPSRRWIFRIEIDLTVAFDSVVSQGIHGALICTMHYLSWHWETNSRYCCWLSAKTATMRQGAKFCRK